MNKSITITRPDDWHLHVRDGKPLADVVPHTARRFARAIIMPNLVPPVTTTDAAIAYRERITAATPKDSGFTPLMTLYLTDETSPEEIHKAKSAGVVACKLYPAGATTNSASGVTRISRLYPTFEAMAECGMLLLVHGEVTTDGIDIFDRERYFLEQVLSPLVDRFPELRVVLEHITTAEAVQFVKSRTRRLAATITPQHLMFNRNHMLVGGVRPHLYCLPILKRRDHQEALQKAAISGDVRFFLGTDSAPHAQHRKETACGCAGCFSAFAAIEFYAEVFESLRALDKLEAFASHYGPDFYGLPRNKDKITLVKEPWTLPQTLPFGDEHIVPLHAGETLHWRLAESSH